MTVVMPSQVVITIDQQFPTAKEIRKQTYYTIGHMARLRGVLNLSNEVPRELLAVSAATMLISCSPRALSKLK
jgi:hypothetical protein